MTAHSVERGPSRSEHTEGAGRSVSKDWLRALKLSASIERDPGRTLAVAFDEIAQMRGDAPAILFGGGWFSFRELSERSGRYARWAQARGLRKGDAVALVMESRPDYVAIWLGLTRIGVVVALINHHLAGTALAHCIRIASPRLILASVANYPKCAEAVGDEGELVRCDDSLESALAAQSRAALDLDAAALPTLSDPALYIYTSGTTGLPKAAIVSHRRIMNWALWFCGLLDVTPDDRMYVCLPLYHSVGGVVAIWATLLGGGSVVLRERFSASAFWTDVVEHGCTLFQYIGELCRYLAHAAPCEAETKHRLRLVVGNGLRPEVWPVFQKRFAIPRILEFYAATESNFSLYNVEGEPGAIGRIPSFLAASRTIQLVRYDAETDAPLRNAEGFCIACGPDEPGEAIARIVNDFEGYLDRAASEKKILRDVFAPGDAWMRSGDLMRRDARGFFYFVDRVGDTFRWKGENVATAEVAQAIAAYPGVIDVTVYGVEVPRRDGRAGMAAIVANESFDIAGLYAHLSAQLPAYARPLFLRLSHGLQVTETFKHRKGALAAEGFDPRKIGAPVFFASSERSIYAALDLALYEKILAGAVPL
ncbi:long-chain-acyl-CoA synthetase [Methylocystis iwaonis]|uniref:Long-chain-acyl-CoA synthetase n=1 Tax=Methylocystis iwaonis TaxID=2885079 RepID=A0ABN6VF37_9HYPH|nr:long-chain-acyl-CoA synthetase [Methylocystis iwaonis]BDV33787.1 long-chain-acyl-CoA synthetase [Methylocystis iwaonis]